MQLISLAIIFFGATPSPAASDVETGTFQAQLEEVVDNCESGSLELKNGTMKIREIASGVEIDLDNVPALRGSYGKRGKLKAEGVIRKPKGTTKLSLSGRIKSDGLRGVLVAEHYEGEAPVCTQSWSIHAKR